MDKKENINELLIKLERSKGKEIINKINDLSISIFILKRNYEELIKALTYYERERSLWDRKNRDKLDMFMKEFLRLIHNYLASIFSLIEHTQRFKKKINNEDFSNKYKIELDKYDLDNFIEFIKDLRHYTQHKNRLPITPTMVIGPSVSRNDWGPLKQRIYLKKEDLLEWKNWKNKSKKLINENNKEIELKTLFRKYQDFITNFYQWLYNEITNIYSKEINEAEEIQSEINNEMLRTNTINQE
jgi:hypothetical protein